MSIWSRIERRLTDLAGELLPDDVHDQLSLAREQIAAGNPRTAVDILEPVVDARPDHVGALSLLGVAELERNRFEEALSAFDRASASRPDFADAKIGRGQALLALERFEDAATAFRSAVEVADGDRDVLAVAYRGAGLSYRRLGQLDKAVRELRKAVAEAPRDPNALTALGEALHVHPDTSDEEAKKYLGWARETDAPSLAFLISGQIALLEGYPDDAAELFAAALNRADLGGRPAEKAGALIGIADVALARGELSEAHQALLRALEITPESVDVHARLAALHVRTDSPDNALAAYDRAAELGAGPEILADAIPLALATGDRERLDTFAAALRATEISGARTELAEIATAASMALGGERAAATDQFRSILERSDSPHAHLGVGELILEDSPALAADHALAALRSARGEARHRARELLANARRAELGIADDRAMVADLVATFTGLERLVLARTELAGLARLVTEAAADFDRPLLVTVMGEFSSGKSTFVNAFIGAEVAPTGITPTTATINVVRHGRERGGRILYRDDRSEDVAWDALFERLRGLTPEEAETISRVEILLPLDILEKVNLVDTPGLNSILPEHEKVARDFIARADAVVWVFSASQAGKKSEGLALGAITDQGVRVLGALNKIDQLSDKDIETVQAMVSEELGDKLEAIVPVSARLATSGDAASRWADLELALETHFFARAKKLKASAARRKLTVVFKRAREETVTRREALATSAAALQEAADAIRSRAGDFDAEIAAAERRTISMELADLYRDAAKEILELVLPRSLPFGSHKATPADRDYLISLLETRLESALAHSRRRVDASIREICALAVRAEHDAMSHFASQGATVPDVIGDASTLLEARVYASALAFLRGYLRGGYVENFFRSDLPKIDLAEDAVYHALYRDAPNVDSLIAKQLAEAGSTALRSVADRLAALSRILAARIADIDAGTLAPLDDLEIRAAQPIRD